MLKPSKTNSSDFNAALNKQFFKQDILKVNLENLGLTRFELVKIEILTEF